jgi:succinylglutamate desuccinylase
MRKNKTLNILLISGAHGNEERVKLILEDYLHYTIRETKKFTNYNITIFQIPNESKTRDVHFNLNRMDQVDKMKELSYKMDELKNHIQQYDIILDLHNSEICQNLLLVSSKNKPNWKVSKEKYLDMVVWRESAFESISEYARKLGKIAFTVEFGGMVSNTERTPKKDIEFLNKVIKLSSEIYNYEKSLKSKAIDNSNEYFDLFDDYNKLRTINLLYEHKLFPGSLISSDSVKEEISKELSEKLNLENRFYYKVISPDGNFTKLCEVVLRRKNKIRSKGLEQ